MTLFPAPQAQLSGREILVSDGDPAWRTAMRLRLTGMGATAFEVSSAQEAVASAASRAFDAILFAVSSEESAIIAAQRFTALPAYGRGPALIGVFSGPGAREIAEAAGLDGFLNRREALEAAPALIALLTPRRSVEAAELDQIEQEDRGDEHDDRNQDGHQSPQSDKKSGAL